MKRLKTPGLGATLGVLMAFCLSSPLLAQTQIDAQNDGHGITAYGHSSDDILSMTIRVTGPEGLVYENSVEDAVIDWVPETELPDGLYNWEARVVTVKPGAPPREAALMSRQSTPRADQASTDGSVPADSTLESDSPKESNDMPLARLFDDQYKAVKTQSGSFRVRDGFMQPIKGEDFDDSDDSVSSYKVDEPGIIGKIAGTMLDLIVPSANAGTCTSPCVVEDANDADIFMESDTDSSEGGPFEIEMELDAGNEIWNLDDQFALTPFFEVNINAPTASFAVSEFGNIGLGTDTPSQNLHISDTAVRIRLEDTNDGPQNWYIKNSNAGIFEIGDSTVLGGALSIEPSAPASALHVDAGGNVGLGTGNPGADLHLAGSDYPQIRISDADIGWDIRAFSDPAFGIRNLNSGTVPFVIDGDAPFGSLWVTGTGVGMGTANPTKKLDIQGTDSATGSANTTAFRVANGSGTTAGREMMRLENNGDVRFIMSTGGETWTFAAQNGSFVINSLANTEDVPMRVFTNGDMRIAGNLDEASSRTLKHGIEPLDKESVLSKLSQLKINEWRYNHSPEITRAGPMAEDWHEAFGLGPNNKSVSPSDMAGIALAAAQELEQRVAELEARLAKYEQ
jgi:hypothetical protein